MAKSKLAAIASPKCDGDWQGRCDADHLMKAQQINADAARRKKAQGHLEKLHKEHMAQAFAAKAAKKKPAPKQAPKPARRRSMLDAGRGYMSQMRKP